MEPEPSYRLRILELSEMLRHHLKNIVAGLGFFAAIVATVPSADAFTETQTTPPAAAQAAPKAEPAPLQLQKPEDGNGLALTAPTDSKTNGTDLNIPGVGKIGTLPKLDFGLELLYGGGNAGPEKPTSEQNDDVLIKGTIKHRF
jgi:hypothetical protein